MRESIFNPVDGRVRGQGKQIKKLIKLIYDTVEMDMGFRADIIVANKVIVEIKSIEAIAPVHSKVLLTCLRLSKLKLGLLVNFNTILVKDAIIRIVNNL